MNQKNVFELIAEIRKKKELQGICAGFVEKEVGAYFLRNTSAKKFISRSKSANYKKIVKEVRANLRRTYGLFWKESGFQKRRELMQDLEKNYSPNILNEILKTHYSTKERLTFYLQLYLKLFKITGKPSVILDLGCGLNPFSFPFMKLKEITYYAYDLSKNEISLLNSFFTLLAFRDGSFKGRADVFDVLQLTELPEADLAFLFKMTDVLDKGKGHKASEKVIKRLPAKFVIVSFSTKTMSGKAMNHPQRGWLELMCKRLDYKLNVLEFSNEIFYVIKKEKRIL